VRYRLDPQVPLCKGDSGGFSGCISMKSAVFTYAGGLIFLFRKKGGFMKKEVDELEDELRSEYDFSKMTGGVKGKYVERYQAGTNLVLLYPDKLFTT